jgi:DNA polymerase-3 subunit beta
MPFDRAEVTPMPQTRALVATTSAAALAAYDRACITGEPAHFADAAHALAAMLRKPKAAKAPKAAANVYSAANLAAALKRLCAVVERKSTIPILSNVRLLAAKGALKLFASDLDMLLEISLSGYEGPKMDLTVPAHTLAGMVAGAEVVTFGALDADNRLAVTIDGAAAMLPTLAAGDFPVMQFGAAATAVVDGPAWADALGFVRATISAEETRYYLNGAYFHLTTRATDGQREMTFVSTDGSRMSKQTVQAPEWDGEPTCAIIPLKTVGIAAKGLALGEAIVELNAEAIRFNFADGSVLTSKVIDGRFPDYTRVIPSGGLNTVMKIQDPKAFVRELTKFGKMSQERSRSVRLALDGKVLASLRNMEGGDVSGPLPATHTGKPLEGISFNSTYFAEMVSAACTVRIGRADDPALFEYTDRPDRLGVLMPLRA